MSGAKYIASRHTAWPTNDDLNLLRAGLLPDARAHASWDCWRAGTGGVADTASLRLLPLAEWNLRRVSGAVSAPGEPGFLETEWLRSERRTASAVSVLRQLEEAGVRPLALKGLALSHLFYPHPALRTMGDIDLLVQPEEFHRARRALETLGWRPVAAEPASRMGHLHGLAFARRGDPELDLHAHALLECCSPDADRGLFERAVSLELPGLLARTISPADHLLHVCVHGLRWSSAPAIHWASDATLILQRAGKQLDWSVLVAEARNRDLAFPLARALRMVRDELGAPVDEPALSELDCRSRGWRRKIEFQARIAPPSLLAGLFLHWCDFKRERRDASPLMRLFLFPGYLGEMWGLAGSWKVPLTAAKKSYARLKGRA